MLVKYSWVNFENKTVEIEVDAKTLIDDWHENADLCPENDELLLVAIIDNQNVLFPGITFESLMARVIREFKVNEMAKQCGV